MDKDTRLPMISTLEVFSRSDERRVRGADLDATNSRSPGEIRVPGYLEAYESCCENLFSELTEVKGKRAHVVDAGIPALRKNCAR